MIVFIFRALSKFRTDQMSLKMLPECFRRDLKLPSEMVKTPADAARKPEDVLDYIPGIAITPFQTSPSDTHNVRTEQSSLSPLIPNPDYFISLWISQ